jgi:hypothetical protein
MLRFQCKPDKIFTDILARSLDIAIAQMDMDIEYGYSEERGGFSDGFFETEIINAFGGGLAGIKSIRHELKRLLAASESEKVFMPTDYHFKLLDRVINAWCDIYNDMLQDMEEEDILYYKGKAIKPTADFIIGAFFWDTDYDFPEHVAYSLKQASRTDPDSVRGQSDIFDSGINASLNLSPDTMDLLLEEWKPDSDWLEDYDPEWE